MRARVDVVSTTMLWEGYRIEDKNESQISNCSGAGYGSLSGEMSFAYIESAFLYWRVI
jgi:hypothetical protein